MSTPIDSNFPGQPVPAPRTTRTHHAGHVIAIVVGCLALLPGLALLAGGTAVAIGQAVATDDDGYYAFTLDRVESTGVAVTTTDLWFADGDDDSPWVLDWLDLDVRIRADGADVNDEIFVGVARAADVDRYLAGTGHSLITEIDDRAPVYRQVPGGELADAPTDQDFWAASASGSGEQELSWEARGGRWAIVVMNADGSPGVDADVELGARSDIVTPIAVGLLIAGGVTVLVAAALIIVGARGRRRSDPISGAVPLSPAGPSGFVQPTSATPSDRVDTPIG